MPGVPQEAQPRLGQAMGEWDRYVLPDYSFTEFGRGSVVMDLGCGQGAQLLELGRRGCIAIGLEMDPVSVSACRRQGLWIMRASAERVPVKSASVDGIVCKVVMPYTDEARVIAEVGRVLRPGGRGVVCYHGAGYYLRYLLESPSWKRRMYGLRTLVNTWTYALTRRRLPGFAGDTIYQSRRRLARYYRDNGIVVVADSPAPGFLRCPVFIYHAIEKAAEPARLAARGGGRRRGRSARDRGE